MKRCMILCTAVAVAACSPYPESSNFSSNEHDEITDIADSSAYGALEDSDKVRELESRIEDLENNIN